MTEVWSPSKVLSYRTCPKQWELRYRTASRAWRAEMAGETPLPMLLGTVAHRGLEAAYLDAQAGFALGSGHMSMFRETALDAIRKASAGLGIDEHPEAEQIEDEVGDVLHTLPVPRRAAVLGVEMTLADEVEGIEFTNVVDLILRTGPTSLHLRDWKRKSVRNLPLAVNLADDPQLCSYRHAAARHFPWAQTVTVGLYSLISNREVSAELPLARAKRTMAGEAATIRKAQGDAECLPTPDGTNCSRCLVRSACPVWTVSPPS